MRITHYIFSLLFIIIVPIASAGQDTLSYSGSSTIGMGILEQGAIKTFEEKTGLRFKSVEHPGSGKGIKSLIGGKVTLAGASRHLSASERDKGVKGIRIGYDTIAVFVHKSNPVDDLTKEQLKGIFSGKLTNWQGVGGRNAQITPNTEILGEKRATVQVFRKLVMDNEPYGDGFKEIDLPKDQLVYLSNDETGICAVSLGLLGTLNAEVRDKLKIASVNGVEPSSTNLRAGKYLISRPLYLATKGVPKGNVKKFIAFMLSPDGQSFVAQKFVPLRTIQ